MSPACRQEDDIKEAWCKVYKRTERGSWYARLVFTDPKTGKKRNLSRRAESKAAATDLLNRLRQEVELTQGKSLDFEDATFSNLADFFEATYAVPAEIRDGRKVSGLKSVNSVLTRLKVLREHFGSMPLRGITHADIAKFRALRLKTPGRGGRDRSIASVNRELQILRRMMNVALQESWILRNPFSYGDRLISAADEKKRERVLSGEEQERLLARCTQPYLRALVVAAADTGMRQGELLKLRWQDVDLEDGVIYVVGTNTKTMTARKVHVTSALTAALLELRSDASKPDDLVFGIKSNVKRSFNRAVKDAGIEDFRFHDLRHTAGTRLAQGGLPLAEVGRILGHAQPQTTYRYLNQDKSTLERAVKILDARQNGGSEQDKPRSRRLKAFSRVTTRRPLVVEAPAREPKAPLSAIAATEP